MRFYKPPYSSQAELNKIRQICSITPILLKYDLHRGCLDGVVARWSVTPEQFVQSVTDCRAQALQLTIRNLDVFNRALKQLDGGVDVLAIGLVRRPETLQNRT